jgi:hypothetical protein
VFFSITVQTSPIRQAENNIKISMR